MAYSAFVHCGMLMIVSFSWARTVQTQCAVPSISNGNYLQDGKIIDTDTQVPAGTVISVACNGGFTISSDVVGMQKTCTEQGDWTPDSELSCTLQSQANCGATVPVLHGGITGGASNVGAFRSVVCNLGYVVEGAAYIRCGSNLAWSTPGECVLMECKNLPFILNGRVANGSSKIMSKRSIVCYNGYEYSALDDTVECLPTATWTNPKGDCLRTSSPLVESSVQTAASTEKPTTTQTSTVAPVEVGTCGDLPEVANGQISDGPNTFGTKAMVTCDGGFKYSNSDRSIECLPSGSWSAPRGVCKEIGNAEIAETTATTQATVQATIACGDVPTIDNGDVMDGDSSVGAKRRVVCAGGFKYSAINRDIECLPSGQWSQPLGVCNAIEGMPVTAAATSEQPAVNGAMMTTQATENQNIECGEVPEIANGQVIDGSSSVGSQRRVVCQGGFRYSAADHTIQCQVSGHWSTFLGICEEVKDSEMAATPGECGKVPDVLNGQVMGGSSAIGSIRRVVCEADFKYSNDDHSVICQSSGAWSQPLGACDSISEEASPSPDSGANNTA